MFVCFFASFASFQKNLGFLDFRSKIIQNRQIHIKPDKGTAVIIWSISMCLPCVTTGNAYIRNSLSFGIRKFLFCFINIFFRYFNYITILKSNIFQKFILWNSYFHKSPVSQKRWLLCIIHYIIFSGIQNFIHLKLFSKECSLCPINFY